MDKRELMQNNLTENPELSKLPAVGDMVYSKTLPKVVGRLSSIEGQLENGKGTRKAVVELTNPATGEKTTYMDNYNNLVKAED